MLGYREPAWSGPDPIRPRPGVHRVFRDMVHCLPSFPSDCFPAHQALALADNPPEPGNALLVLVGPLENWVVPAPGDDISGLLAQARAGSREATSRLLELVRPHLEVCARKSADPNEAAQSTADLVQEAWLRAWQHLDQFAADGTEEEVRRRFLGWVGQITRNLALNRHRDHKALKRRPAEGAILRLDPARGAEDSNPGLKVSDPGATPSAVVGLDEETLLVQRALEALPDPVGRSAIRLRFFDGLSLRQVSQRLGVSYDQLLERYHASLAELEQRLGGLQ